MLDIFLSLQFFWQKNISVSLCRQIAKLKLPTCGQSLRGMLHDFGYNKIWIDAVEAIPRPYNSEANTLPLGHHTSKAFGISD